MIEHPKKAEREEAQRIASIEREHRVAKTIDDFVAKIDAMILSRGTENITETSPIVCWYRGDDELAIREVRRRYSVAGWNVSTVHSARIEPFDIGRMLSPVAVEKLPAIDRVPEEALGCREHLRIW